VSQKNISDGTVKPVRVRFAPSPRGGLSVKGARTAVFNWLYAKSRGGAFILRLYDVDLADRLSGQEDALLDDMAWLGLTWDEGPRAGGAHGPYRQSERLDDYAAKAMELLEEGVLYRCFCTGRELEEEGRRAREAGLPPVYSGKCASLTSEESDRRAGSGAPHTVRFKVPESGSVVIDDLVRGRVTLGAQMVGDFVVLDESSLPTYDFAAVLDDASMGITHVLRGEDRLPNTIRQVLLYRAMGYETPEFGHLPLVTRPDGDKLEGRRGAAAIKWFRDNGYLPKALFNYLALLGWSPGNEREVVDVGGLLRFFTLEGVNSEAVALDGNKLSWMNAHYLRSVPEDEFWRLALEYLPDSWLERLGEERARRAALLARGRVKTLGELASEVAPLVDLVLEDAAAEVLREEWAAGVLVELERVLEGRLSITGKEFLAVLSGLGKSLPLQGKSIFVPVRAAITGRLEGLEIGGVAELLGVDELRARLRAALRARGQKRG
jgi:glutamyl-tRNA synthetase